MKKHKQPRPWFHVTRALQDRLGITLGRAARITRVIAFVWLHLTTKQFPPEWLFRFGTWCDYVGTKLYVSVLRIRFNRKKRRLEAMVAKAKFEMQCATWMQIAFMLPMMGGFPAGRCDRMGSLGGRMARYGRTFNPTNKHEMELFEDAASQIRAAFLETPKETRKHVILAMVGARESADAPDETKSLLREVLEEVCQQFEEKQR